MPPSLPLLLLLPSISPSEDASRLHSGSDDQRPPWVSLLVIAGAIACLIDLLVAGPRLMRRAGARLGRQLAAEQKMSLLGRGGGDEES